MGVAKSEEALFPPTNIEIHEENLWDFFTYIKERQDAWYRRTLLKQDRPWSKHPYISTYKFCNVYRELDRSSQWLINHVFFDKKLCLEDVLFSILVFRIFNLPETFSHIKIPKFHKYDKDLFIKDLDHVRYDIGIQPINKKAYNINTWLSTGECYRNYADIFVPQLHAKIPELIRLIKSPKTSPVDIVNLFRSINGIGIFLSHEYFIDLTYLRRYVDQSMFPFTEDDWTHILPGSKKGLRYLFPSVRGDKEQTKSMYVLRDASPWAFKELGGFKYLNWSRDIGYSVSSEGKLSVHQIEFNLCEYQKLQRLQHNIGRIEVFKQRTF